MVQGSPGRACGWIFAWLVLSGSHLSHAQPANNRAQDEAAVRQAGKDYLAAIERDDLKALADFWTADGTYTDETGRTVKVREQLAKSGGPGSGTGPRSNDANAKLRFVAADVAIEEGEIDSPPVDGGAPAKRRYTALWIREAGKWKLENVRETPIELTSNAEQVASLGVFTGEWTGEANKFAIQVSAKWDANRKFLQRNITMTSGKASLVGTQQIGWDPISQQIRSWMFSDDGSYSEGLWTRESNKWIVISKRVLPDGKVSNSTQVYKFPDKNTLLWKSIDGSIGGQPTDDFEVVLKRSAPK